MDNSNKARLAPLTAAELAALPAIGGAAQDDGVLVSPVPANAPPMPSAHSKWGKPSASWPYRDALFEPIGHDFLHKLRHGPQELQLPHKPPRHEKNADTDPDGEQHRDHCTAHPTDRDNPQGIVWQWLLQRRLSRQ
jgi:hypothetical protein